MRKRSMSRLVYKMIRSSPVLLKKEGGSDNPFYLDGQMVEADFYAKVSGVDYAVLVIADEYLFRARRNSDGACITEYIKNGVGQFESENLFLSFQIEELEDRLKIAFEGYSK